MSQALVKRAPMASSGVAFMLNSSVCLGMLVTQAARRVTDHAWRPCLYRYSSELAELTSTVSSRSLRWLIAFADKLPTSVQNAPLNYDIACPSMGSECAGRLLVV